VFPDEVLHVVRVRACRSFVIDLFLRFYPDLTAAHSATGTAGAVSPLVRSAVGDCAAVFVEYFAPFAKSAETVAKRIRSARSSSSSGQAEPATSGL
jgi:hypothetical protein